MTPPELASGFHSLPPILHVLQPNPMSSCSKAPRGLFVLVRVDGIFTANASSPSPSLRQCPYRCAIRAGRNLPDKEFRYLRTVIVTAAVYWGLSSSRKALPLTFQHWAGVSPYTSTFVLARTCVFSKQSHGLFHCGLTCVRQALSRSYGRYFAEFLNEGSLVHLGLLDLNTCVGLRYGQPCLTQLVFSGQSLLLTSPFSRGRIPCLPTG